MIKNKIIFWGADHTNELGIVRQLGNQNLDVLFLINGHKRNCATKSKYCTKYKETSGIDEGMSFLKENYCNEPVKTILIATGDKTAEAIDQHQKELSPYFILPGTKKSGLLSKYDDKNVMADFAKRHGFNVPLCKEFCYNSSLDGIEYPCILKPTFKYKGRTEFKTQLCRSEKELKSIMSLMNHHNRYMLQQYIEKDFDMVLYGCRFNDNSVSLAGVFYKDRWSDDGGGSHGFILPDLPDYLNIDGVYSALDEIDYHGLFSVEYALKDGVAYFYEFNFRNDATSHLFYQSGANLPLAWVYDCVGLSKENIPQKVEGKHYVMNEILDQINIKRGVVSKEKWNKERKEATAFYYYDENDLEPWKVANRTAWFNRWVRSMALKYRPVFAYIMNKI